MKFTDGKRTVEITIRRWNGSSYGPDWSGEYFSDADNYDRGTDTYTVPDVDYCIEMARSTDEEGACFGDPDMCVFVDEL